MLSNTQVQAWKQLYQHVWGSDSVTFEPAFHSKHCQTYRAPRPDVPNQRCFENGCRFRQLEMRNWNRTQSMMCLLEVRYGLCLTDLSPCTAPSRYLADPTLKPPAACPSTPHSNRSSRWFQKVDRRSKPNVGCRVPCVCADGSQSSRYSRRSGLSRRHWPWRRLHRQPVLIVGIRVLVTALANPACHGNVSHRTAEIQQRNSRFRSHTSPRRGPGTSPRSSRTHCRPQLEPSAQTSPPACSRHAHGESW